MNTPILIAVIALIIFLFTFVVPPMGAIAQKASALLCAICLIIGLIMHYT